MISLASVIYGVGMWVFNDIVDMWGNQINYTLLTKRRTLKELLDRDNLIKTEQKDAKKVVNIGYGIMAFHISAAIMWGVAIISILIA
jgi:hypothetical protein